MWHWYVWVWIQFPFLVIGLWVLKHQRLLFLLVKIQGDCLAQTVFFTSLASPSSMDVQMLGSFHMLNITLWSALKHLSTWHQACLWSSILGEMTPTWGCSWACWKDLLIIQVAFLEEQWNASWLGLLFEMIKENATLLRLLCWMMRV